MTRFDIINDLELSHPNLCNLFGGHISDPDPEFKIKLDAKFYRPSRDKAMKN